MRALTLNRLSVPPVALAMVAQFGAVLAGFACAFIFAILLRVQLPVAILVWLIGLLALVFGVHLALPAWWQPIQLLFVPAIYWALQIALPPWVYLIGLLLCLLLLGNSLFDRVPLYLSSRAVWITLESQLPTQQGARVLDLGSGLGGGLAWLARKRPDLCFVGIESSPLLWLIARVRMLRHPNAKVHWGTLWSVNLGENDFVYAFLSPAPMLRLWKKVRSEMKPGALFVSNSFEVPGETADMQIPVADRRGSRLHLWRM